MAKGDTSGGRSALSGCGKDKGRPKGTRSSPKGDTRGSGKSSLKMRGR